MTIILFLVIIIKIVFIFLFSNEYLFLLRLEKRQKDIRTSGSLYFALGNDSGSYY